MAFGSVWAGIPPASAVDWEVLYQLSETLRVSDNIQLRPESEGAGFSSNTSARLDITARTPTVTWLTSGTMGHLIFFGQGIPEPPERTTMSARSDLLKTTRSTDYRVSAFFRQAPATRTFFTDPRVLDPDLIDPDLPDPIDPLLPDPEDPVFPIPVLADVEIELLDFDRISYGATGSLVHRRTRADNMSLSGSITRSDFTGDAADTATPSTSAQLSGLWARRLTRRVNGRARASVRYFRAEDDSELQRLTYNVAVGAFFQASPRLTVDANVGVSITDQRQSIVTTGASQTDLSVGWDGNFALSYSPRHDTTMTIALTQRQSPDGLGNLRSQQSARGTVNYRINEWSSINLSGTFASSSAAGDGGASSQAWRVSPSYTHELARNWDLSLSYQWVKTDEAQSNTALLTLSYRGTILP